MTYKAPGAGFFIQQPGPDGPAIFVEDADDFEPVRPGHLIDMRIQKTVESGGNVFVPDSLGGSQDGYEAGSIGIHYRTEPEGTYIQDIGPVDLFNPIDTGDAFLDELVYAADVEIVDIEPEPDTDPDRLLVAFGANFINLYVPDGTGDFGGSASVGATFDIVRGVIRRLSTGDNDYALFLWNPDFWTPATNPDIADFSDVGCP